MTCLINLFLQLAKQHSGMYVDTSAKTKENIHKVKKKGGWLERCLTDTLDCIGSRFWVVSYGSFDCYGIQ